MKKIFIIISGVLTVFIIVLLSVLVCVKKNIGFAIYEPRYIHVYNKSTTTTNNDEPYEKDDKEYVEILNQLTDMTTLSLFKLAQNNKNLYYKIEYDAENYAGYDTTMKEKNLVIELIYDKEREVVVYNEGNPVVIPFKCLLFIIPIDAKFDEIIVYNALGNEPSKKEEQYKNCTPFILKGNVKDILSYANSLK